MLLCVRTTVQLDDDLLARAKQFAAKTGRTLTAVIEDALRAALTPNQKKRDKKSIELPTYGRDGVLPGVDLDDSASLLAVMDSAGDPD